MSKDNVVISDIHSNAVALEAVIEREGRDKEYFVLGDLVGLNAYPAETIELIQSLDAEVLLGNHDRAIFHEGEGHVNSSELSRFELEHTLSSLSDEQQAWVRELPYMRVLEGSPRVCLTHAYPWPEKASGYERGNAGVQKRDVVEIAATVSDDYDIVLSGHTHEKYEIDCSKFGHDVLFANPASLGWDGNYATLDTETKEVELKSVEYDEEKVRKHIQSVLPEDAPSVERWQS